MEVACKLSVQEEFESLYSIFNSKTYYPVLINGFKNSKVFYVKSKYVNVITQSISQLSIRQDEKSLNDYIDQVIQALQDEIQSINIQNDEIEENENEMISSHLQEVAAQETQEDWLTYKYMTQSWQYNPSIKQKFKPEYNLTEKNLENIGLATMYRSSNIQMYTVNKNNYQRLFITIQALKLILQNFLQFKDENRKQTQAQQQQNGGHNTILLDIITLGMHRLKKQQQFQVMRAGQATFKQFKIINCQILVNLQSLIRSLLHCWSISPNMIHHIHFTEKGIEAFKPDYYQSYNAGLIAQIKLWQEATKNCEETLKVLILEILNPLWKQFTVETMDAFLQIWIAETNRNQNSPLEEPPKFTSSLFLQSIYSDSIDSMQQESDIKRSTQLYKIIEILMNLNLPFELFFNALLQCQTTQRIIEFYQRPYPSRAKNTHPYSDRIANIENRIMFFVYTCLSYSLLEEAQIKDKDYLKATWKSIMKFLQ